MGSAERDKGVMPEPATRDTTPRWRGPGDEVLPDRSTGECGTVSWLQKPWVPTPDAHESGGPLPTGPSLVRDDEGVDERYRGFPDGFFTRVDDAPDDLFYTPARLVAHLDGVAIEAVGALYAELEISGDVLDICSSWISHFRTRPAHLVVLGMNAVELEHNPHAAEWLVQDLNRAQGLPFPDASFDAATCCVSVDYLVRPIEVFDEVARVLRSGSPFICTFSNRCFPTKAIRGWRTSSDTAHVGLVEEYFHRSRCWLDIRSELRTAPDAPGDPLYAVWARRP